MEGVEVAKINKRLIIVSGIEIPWWRDDEKYCIGSLSKKTIKLDICNLLTKQVLRMEVPSEETMEEIQERCDPVF